MVEEEKFCRRPLLPPPMSTASRPLPDSSGGFERVMPTPGMPALGVPNSNGPPAFASQQSNPASLGGTSCPGSGVGVSAFRAVGSQLAVASPAVKPATSPLPWYFHQLYAVPKLASTECESGVFSQGSPETGRRGGSSGRESISPAPSSTAR